jgi:hypothetical protein
MSSQYILADLYQTNSTSPVPIADFTNYPMSGTYVILTNLAISTAKKLQSFNFGIYNNGSLISNSDRSVQFPGSNIKSEFSTIFYTTIISPAEITLRVNTTSINSPITIHQGNVILIRLTTLYQTILTTPYSTNNTIGVPIDEFTQMPQSGSYIVSLNIEYELSRLRSFTIYARINAATIPGSLRTIAPSPNLTEVFNISFLSAFTGAETLTIYVLTQNSLTTLTISSGTLLLIPMA